MNYDTSLMRSLRWTQINVPKIAIHTLNKLSVVVTILQVAKAALFTKSFKNKNKNETSNENYWFKNLRSSQNIKQSTKSEKNPSNINHFSKANKKSRNSSFISDHPQNQPIIELTSKLQYSSFIIHFRS